MDVGSHVVDLLDMLLGPLAVDASSSAASRSAAYGDVPTEDLVVMDFTCGCVGGGQQPARGQCRWDFAQPKGRGRKELLRIVGSERTVTFRPLASDGITVETTGERGTAATQWIPLPPSQHVHQNLIQSIVNELLATRQSGEGRAVAATPATAEGLGLLGLERCPSTGETGARANDHLDAVLSTFYGPRSIGFWDLESPQGTGAGTGVARAAAAAAAAPLGANRHQPHAASSLSSSVVGSPPVPPPSPQQPSSSQLSPSSRSSPQTLARPSSAEAAHVRQILYQKAFEEDDLASPTHPLMVHPANASNSDSDYDDDEVADGFWYSGGGPGAVEDEDGGGVAVGPVSSTGF